SPESASRFIMRVTFSYLEPLLSLGVERPLKSSDLYELDPRDRAADVDAEFALTDPALPLYRRVLHVIRWSLFIQISLAVAGSTASFGAPFFLNRIVHYVQEEADTTPRGVAVAYVVCLFVFSIATVLCNTNSSIYGRRSAGRARVIVISEVYRHALARGAISGEVGPDGQAPEDSSIGKIITVMSVDAERLRDFIVNIHLIVTTPIQIVVGICLLLWFLGWPALGGVAVMCTTIPITSLYSSWAVRIRTKCLEAADRRVQVTNEVLASIRIIKYFAWESQFAARIREARAAELSLIVWQFVARYMDMVIWNITPLLVSLVTFWALTILAGRELDATVAFTALSLFRVLRNPMTDFPDVLSDIFDATASYRRIRSFLDEKELERYSLKAELTSPLTGGVDPLPVAGFSDATFSWSDAGADDRLGFTLANVDVDFPLGALSSICGATGAGKSSLVQALLGEMKCVSGRVHLPISSYDGDVLGCNQHRGVAYVAQTAWLMNGTVRENICFGYKYDPERYQAVVQACALVKDFQTFPGGDLTEVGEKGINLSGGQKQRISLARAAYSPAAFLLLDDPLSAVDAPTARHLFEQCIVGLLAGRTRILVTHAVTLALPRTDFLLVLKNGAVLAQGAPSTVLALPHVAGIMSHEELLASEREQSAVVQAEVVVADHAEGKAASKLIQKERKEQGAVTRKLYLAYFWAAGGLLFLLPVAFAQCLRRGSLVGTDWWLKKWAEAYRTKGPGEGEGVDVEWYLWMYVAWIGLVFSSLIISFFAATIGAFRAGKSFHEALVDRILGAPVSFFDQTPLGRILNRFSKDISSVDNRVMNACVHFTAQTFAVGYICLVCIIITPIVVVGIIPIGFMYRWVARLYLSSSRELKRIDSITRSPIYAQFSETLTGAPTIRAYGHESRFSREMQDRIDDNHRAHWWMFAVNTWFGLRTGAISALCALCAGLAIVSVATQIDPGYAGLALLYALSFADNLVLVVRAHANLEMELNSVERVAEYLNIQQEPPTIIEGCRPPANWPSKGEIVVKDLSVRYSPDADPVLKDVSFAIRGGEKVGIVGRTGAGKSTLSLALFRIIDEIHGSILIDGVDTATLGLRDLRSNLTIIPQDPVLFTGSVRSNVDPFSEHPDYVIWGALQRSRFLASLDKEHAIDSGEGMLSPSFSLDAYVAENGGNFSQGQKQLLCLARALLRLQRTPIVVLDEATASVDDATDTAIQATIRGEEFKHCTVLCVAHRLRTVADYDRILVLDHGRLVESGTPWDLLQLEDGWFRKMCAETADYPLLLELARNASRR
ncbi:P-loop containing nucleoside triphosphate hydrolase protein, partial [Blyttiomyces helicus]